MTATILTWANGYECHLGNTGDRRCVVSKTFAADQKGNDGKTTIALLSDGTRMRVKLVGSDYGLWTSGTGDMVVRPIAKIGPRGGPRAGAGRKPTGRKPMTLMLKPSVRKRLDREAERQRVGASALVESTLDAVLPR